MKDVCYRNKILSGIEHDILKRQIPHFPEIVEGFFEHWSHVEFIFLIENHINKLNEK